jgi:hypothetical protein
MSQIEHELQMELHWKRNEVRHGAGNPAHLEIEGTVNSMRTSYRRMEEDQRRLGLRQRLALSDGRQVDTCRHGHVHRREVQHGERTSRHRNPQDSQDKAREKHSQIQAA